MSQTTSSNINSDKYINTVGTQTTMLESSNKTNSELFDIKSHFNTCKHTKIVDQTQQVQQLQPAQLNMKNGRFTVCRVNKDPSDKTEYAVFNKNTNSIESPNSSETAKILLAKRSLCAIQSPKSPKQVFFQTIVENEKNNSKLIHHRTNSLPPQCSTCHKVSHLVEEENEELVGEEAGVEVDNLIKKDSHFYNGNHHMSINADYYHNST